MNIQRSKVYVLIIDDEPAWRKFSQGMLIDDGYVVETADALSETFRLLQQDGYDLVVISSDLLKAEEKEILDNLGARCQKTRLVVMSEPFLSRTRSLAESRAALKLGAKDWFSKPMGRRPLISLIDALLVGHSGGTRW